MFSPFSSIFPDKDVGHEREVMSHGHSHTPKPGGLPPKLLLSWLLLASTYTSYGSVVNSLSPEQALKQHRARVPLFVPSYYIRASCLVPRTNWTDQPLRQYLNLGSLASTSPITGICTEFLCLSKFTRSKCPSGFCFGVGALSLFTTGFGGDDFLLPRWTDSYRQGSRDLIPSLS